MDPLEKVPEEQCAMNNSSIAGGFDLSRRELIIGGALAAVGLGLSGKLAAESPSQSTSTSPPNHPGNNDMNSITTKDGTTIFFKDWGSGQPIVFSHGWPLSADGWDAQMLFFLWQGFRARVPH